MSSMHIPMNAFLMVGRSSSSSSSVLLGGNVSFSMGLPSYRISSSGVTLLGGYVLPPLSMGNVSHTMGNHGNIVLNS